MKVKVSLCFNRKIEVWRLQRVKSDLPAKLGDLTLPSFHSSRSSHFNICGLWTVSVTTQRSYFLKKSSLHNKVKLN